MNEAIEANDEASELRRGPDRWERIIYFFPVQLLFVHLKKNLVLLLFWLILFAIVTESLGSKYGVPYLFLQPEYMGGVNFLSHFIIGITMGGFIMAFNISSYVVNGFRFPFLATLNRPFIKYCQNNTLIPLAFVAVYLFFLVGFQLEEERIPPLDVLFNIAGFLTGNLMFILLTVSYFAFTNKNSQSYRSDEQPEQEPDQDYTRAVKDLFSNRKQWKELGLNRKQWKVVTYISDWGKIGIARDSSHYNQSTLNRVFAQNQINASLFQVAVMLLLFGLGWFYENDWLMIPAAGSVLLFFTIFIMITSAVYSWFKGWTSVVLIALLLGINYLSQQEPFEYASQAYGLNYDTLETPYTQSKIRFFQEDDEVYKLDVTNGMRRLENWRSTVRDEKPIAVFINVPGGGLRSAVWTALSLSQANAATDGELWKHSVLISGSSGGMIGAAYLREFYLRTDSMQSSNLLFEDLSSDKLNPVAATAVMNDLFFRFRSFEYSGRQYTNDRAHAFERRLNNDTRGWLDRTLHDYAALEFEAKTPMMVLAPTISDDGRKLIISAQGTSFLAHNTAPYQINENIEFRRFFAVQDADSLSFLSALRMSATFPYVFPASNLPSDPSIEILDAGIRDNYGISNTLKYIYTFRHWLVDNTSGILLIQVRDQQKFIDLKPDKSRSLWESITQPFGTFYNTVLDVQDYQMEEQLRLAYEWYDGPIEMRELILERDEQHPISLSWHLTEKEKQRIKNSSLSAHNQEVFNYLKGLFEEGSKRID
jgi:hypothetical protein